MGTVSDRPKAPHATRIDNYWFRDVITSGAGRLTARDKAVWYESLPRYSRYRHKGSVHKVVSNMRNGFFSVKGGLSI